FSITSPRRSARLTLVCKHWRSVARSAACLWSGVLCGGREHTSPSRYLHLSRSFPLRVMVHDHVEEASVLFAGNPSRIQHLLMTDNIADTTSWTRRWDPRQLLSMVASELISCTLNFYSWPRTASLDMGQHLFSGQGQRLRRLSIYNSRMTPTDHLPNLTHLLLDRIIDPDRGQILGLLQRCPLLEEVLIHSTRDMIEGHSPRTNVSLPHLRRLSLDVQSPTAILARLEPSPRALIHIGHFSHPSLADIPTLPLCHDPALPQRTKLRISEPATSPLTRSLIALYDIELAA
ncbi:uncharacterized protein BXZ73DRAFT_25557, partial [Epithele typhae]|uniref:uncharacterized protein n=1 Tax=Epithele typhae TaxID=378194 RepID=UPI00200847C3